MRGNNPILALKLHILLHILMKSIRISFKPLHPLSFDETIEMRGNNPILALKLHILLHILMKSIHVSFKTLQPTFI